MIKIRVDVEGLLPLKKQLKLLQMSPKMRRRLLNKVAKKVIKASKKRVSSQKDLQGRPYAKRARKRTKNRRKMLSRLVKQLKVIKADGQTATAGFYNKVQGRIAADQQFGKTTTVTARNISQDGGSNDKNKLATRRQAKALIDEGFKVKRAKGKGKKRPSIKFITQNYSRAQAGVILRKVREKAGQNAKTSWTTTLPARSFLGATGAEVQQYIVDIFDQMNQEIKRHGIR